MSKNCLIFYMRKKAQKNVNNADVILERFDTDHICSVKMIVTSGPGSRMSIPRWTTNDVNLKASKVTLFCQLSFRSEEIMEYVSDRS